MPRRRSLRPPGRPPEMTDARKVTIRFSTADYRRLQQETRRAGVSVAAILRLLVHRHLPGDRYGAVDWIRERSETPCNRSELLQVTLTGAEHTALKNLSREAGVAMSVLVRRALRECGFLPTTADSSSMSPEPEPARGRRND